MESKYFLWVCKTDEFGFYEGCEETLFVNKEDAIQYGIDFAKNADRDYREIEQEDDGYYMIRKLYDCKVVDYCSNIAVETTFKCVSGYKSYKCSSNKYYPEVEFEKAKPGTEVRAYIVRKPVF